MRWALFRSQILKGRGVLSTALSKERNFLMYLRLKTNILDQIYSTQGDGFMGNLSHTPILANF